MVLASTPRRNPTPEPAVVAESAAALPALPLPAFLIEQHAAWRSCLYAETRTKAATERLAAVIARQQREEAGR